MSLHPLRRLLRRPVFTLTVTVTLAVGVTGTSLVFSMINAVLLSPLPFPESDRLVKVWESSAEDPSLLRSNVPQAYWEWAEQHPAFEQTAAYIADGDTTFELNLGQGARRIAGAVVSRNFFSLLGVSPAVGSGFSSDPEIDDGGLVVVISDRFRRQELASEKDPIGRAVRLNDLPYTVIGVMPADFSFPSGVDLWLPDPEDAHRAMNVSLPVFTGYEVIARLAPGTSIEDARSSMAVTGHQIADSFPASHEGMTYRVISLRDELVGNARRTLLLLFGAVAGVLLLVCGNLAFLMLTRALSLYRDLLVRLALGASKRQVLGTFLSESLWLSIFGGALSLLIAVWVLETSSGLVPFDLYRQGAELLDGRVLVFTFLISVCAALLSSLAPILKLSKLPPAEVMRAGGVGLGRRSRLASRALPVVEIALVVVLLIGSGLLIKSLSNLYDIDLGVETSSAFKMKLTFVQSRYPDRATREELLGRALEELRALPGAQAAGGAVLFPMTEGSYQNAITEIDGEPVDDIVALSNFVTAQYFEAMGIPVRSGRAFTDRDDGGAPAVAIVDDALAARLWPKHNAIGRRIEFEGTDREIVGVVATTRKPGPKGSSGPQIYIPYEQSRLPWPFATLVVRGRAPQNLIASATEAVGRLDHELAVTDALTLRRVVEEATEDHSFVARLLSLFSAAAFLLAAIGIYGVTSYVAHLRLHELAVHLALGARPGNLFAMVLKEGAWHGALGIALGLVGAWWLTPYLTPLLYGVEQWDLKVWGLTASICFLVPVIAGLGPARRASRSEPMRALKSF